MAPLAGVGGGDRRRVAVGPSAIRLSQDVPFPSLNFGRSPATATAAAINMPVALWRWPATSRKVKPEEFEGLTSGECESRAYENKFDWLRAALLLSISLLWTMLAGGILYCVWVFRTNMGDMSSSVMPVMSDLVNHTLGLLQNADAASMHVRVTAASGQAISDTALPQVMQALNATHAIVTRLENLAKHPVVQLSLGGENR